MALVYEYKGLTTFGSSSSQTESSQSSQLVTYPILSHIPKRFVNHATVAAKLYSSKKGKIVKDYLEDAGLKAWAAKTKGVDDAGAESAEVVLVMDLDFI